MSRTKWRREMLRRLRRLVAPMLVMGFGAYLAYHTVNGQRGLVGWLQLSSDIAALEAELTLVSAERAVWERRARLLRPEGLDTDMLDEQARKILGYGQENERTYVLPPIDDGTTG